MPIDPNIAMGVRPIEQPNMLGQMAQAMQIRQANQEYEDVNAMRSIAAKYGGDISNPDFLKEVGMRSPKTAADLRAKALANDKTTGEIVKSRLETSRELLSNVRTPEEYLAWHQGNHKDPLLGPLLASKGITADTSMATIQASLSKPGGFEELLKKSAMGLEKFYQDQTSRRNTDVSSGASYQQAETARQRLKMDQGGTWASVIVGDRVMEHNNRTGEWREATLPESTGGAVSVLPPTTLPPATGGGGAAPGVAPQTAPTNALAPQTAPAAPVVNALVQPPATATPAPARQPLTTFNPKKVVRETTNSAGDVTQYNERGEVIGVVPKAGKPSAAYEKDLVTEAKKVEGQKTVNTLVSSLADQYKGLLQEGGITSTAKGSLSNISARSGSSTVGQFAAGFVGTKAQELRDSIAQTRPLIINAIKDSTGMSAQQLNSNVELQNFLKAATDPSLSIEANLKALNNISKLYGLGTEFTMAEMKGATPASTGNIATDPTIDALLKKYK